MVMLSKEEKEHLMRPLGSDLSKDYKLLLKKLGLASLHGRGDGKEDLSNDKLKKLIAKLEEDEKTFIKD